MTIAALMTAGADRYDRRASAGPMQIASSASWTGRRLAIGLAVGDDGLEPERPAGAQDPQRDLAAVGDQDLAEHQASLRSACSATRAASSMTTSSWPYSTRLARLDEARADDPVGRRDHLLGDAQHVDRAEPIAGPDARPGLGLGPRLEDADGRRRGDDR